jgi:hypothetical protein
MTPTLTGGCACGAVRYEATGRPVFQNHCHCRDCQRRSGTGHGSYLSFVGGVTVSGPTATWAVAADSGNRKTHAFCPTCGTPVFVTFAAMPGLVALHAASLDDPGAFAPTAVTFAARGLSWDSPAPGLDHFAATPPG